MNSPLEILLVDYNDERQAADLVALLDAYARDPMGGGKPLNENVKSSLASALANVPHAFSLIAYVDGQPAALANCLEGFSTFAAQPLINVHDFVVLPAFRRQQLSQTMMAEVERIAREKGCCKITLEVLSNNKPAQLAYTKFGFEGYQLDANAGSALFWQKPLPQGVSD